MNGFSFLVNALDKVLKILLTILMAFLVLDVCWQVFTRFVLSEPSSYTEELSRFILIWIGLLGAALAYGEQMHLGIDILTNKLTGNKKLIVDLSVHIVSALFAIFVLIIGGYKLVQLTLELKQQSASLGLMMGYVYLALPVSGILILLYSFHFIAADLNLVKRR